MEAFNAIMEYAVIVLSLFLFFPNLVKNDFDEYS
jgi:hypothetical protein